MSFPSIEQLLVEGGDARICLSGARASNQYGCGVVPNEVLLPFGSATASTISKKGLAAATIIYQKLSLPANFDTQYPIYEQELDKVRQELKKICGLNKDNHAEADVDIDVDIVFAASGTDLHLIAAQLLAAQSDQAMLIIMVETGETGSAVPAALSGLHFSDRTALGARVDAGSSINTASNIALTTVQIRQADGKPRDINDVDDEVESLAKTAIAQGKRVLLILADVTKTGMIAPSIACAKRLHDQHTESLEVMVDACQFRIATSTLRAYLSHQFLVAVTGSKFLTGPSFSGALFFPTKLVQQLRQQTVPETLLPYSSRADWPRQWSGADNLTKLANAGLLLRWVAALAEFREFQALPEHEIQHCIHDFQIAIEAYFQTHPQLSLLPTPKIDRSALKIAPNWDQLPTIFSFLLLDPTNEKPRSRAKTAELYRTLQETSELQLGQPVNCGHIQQTPVSALRLCLSARLIVEALNGKNGCSESVIKKAIEVLDKTILANTALIENQ